MYISRCRFGAMKKALSIGFGLASVMALGGVLALPSSAQTIGARPKNLIVYYGIPSLVNGSTTIAQAQAVFMQYDYIIFGDGLENPTNTYNASTKTIVQYLVGQGKKVFGYIDIGVTTQNLSIAQIQTKITNWKAMGITGLFYDDFGYEYGVTRTRQSAALDAAHTAGLGAILNANDPDDVFKTPTGTTDYPHVYTDIDYYFYEGYQIQLGNYVKEVDWQKKSSNIRWYQSQFTIPFRVLSVATPDNAATFTAAKYSFAWHSAMMYGHTATGWSTDNNYSAANSVATYRTPPTTNPTNPNPGLVYGMDADNGWLSIEYTDLKTGGVPAAYW